jgi:methionine synthase II (cobalamin-independent)
LTKEEIEKLKASHKKQAKEKMKYIKKMYKQLLKHGWTLNQIDEMDIHFYLDLFNETEENETVYIDELRLF